MVPDETKACVGMEYFCFQGDDVWDMEDEKLVEMATSELAKLGLVDAAKVEKGYVTRVPLAYPMYDPDYGERVEAVKDWLGILAGDEAMTAAVLDRLLHKSYGS